LKPHSNQIKIDGKNSKIFGNIYPKKQEIFLNSKIHIISMKAKKKMAPKYYITFFREEKEYENETMSAEEALPEE